MSRIAEFIRQEANGDRSRDSYPVNKSTVIVPADILGIVTATGKAKPWDKDAEDGSEVIAAIAIDYPDRILDRVVTINNDAEVELKLLNFEVADKALVEAGLRALGIKART